MQWKRILSALIFLLVITATFNHVLAQTDAGSAQVGMQASDKRHAIGSSLFLLGNLAPGDPVYFFQLNYGYQLTHQDIIFTEAITWTYYEPLGTYGSSDEKYPGKIRAWGLGVGYQRFLWKHFYMTAQATPFWQQFFDEDDQKIQNGFQLYLQSRFGYRFEFLNQRWFLEPSVACNYWPVNTNFPEAFEEIERGNPNYFLFEPGLNFGFRF